MTTGASFTAVTLTLIVSVSVCGPPEPVNPRSSDVIVIVAEPLKFALGVKVVPSRAALMSVMAPTICTLEVPLPMTVTPAVEPVARVPLVEESVTWMALPPASTSDTEMALPLEVEKTRFVSSATVCVPGTLFTGASLTALTVMLTVSVSLSGPPAPVLPLSLAVTVSEAEPLKFALGE